MKFIKTFESIVKNLDLSSLSEGLQFHISESIPLMESVYRIESQAWISLVCEARNLWEMDIIDLDDDDVFLISTDAGKTGIFEGEKILLDVPFWAGDDPLDEAEYQGREVDLNKPFRTSGQSRKFSVYTKNESGKVVKVNFGQPGMKIRNDDPKASLSFRKRMRCDSPGPRWKPRWWSCNVIRYRKLLGIKSSKPW